MKEKTKTYFANYDVDITFMTVSIIERKGAIIALKIVECFPPPSANQCGNQQPLKLQVLLDLHLLTAGR